MSDLTVNKPDKKSLAQLAREQRMALAQHKQLLGEMVYQAGLEHLGIATLQEILAWVKTQVPGLLAQLPCPQGATHTITHDGLSHTIWCVKCQIVFMTVPPVQPTA